MRRKTIRLAAADKPKRQSWEDATTIEVKVPRCPKCQSLEFKKQRTDRFGDGDPGGIKRVTCVKCGYRFKISCDSIKRRKTKTQFGLIRKAA